MGAFVSQLLFRRPKQPTYLAAESILTYDPEPTNRTPVHPNLPYPYRVHLATHAPQSCADAQCPYRHAPMTYVRTRTGESIPVAVFEYPDSHHTVIMSHMNAEDLGMAAAYASRLSAFLETTVVVYDYTGYGLATGRPSEAGCTDALRATLAFVTDELGVPLSRVVLLGRSLGCGPTVAVAASAGGRGVGGVILTSAFASVRRVGVWHKRTRRGDLFASVDRIADVRAPVLLVHGTSDRVVSLRHARALRDAAPHALDPLFVAGATHTDLETKHQEAVFGRYLHMLVELRRMEDVRSGAQSAGWRDGPQSGADSAADSAAWEAWTQKYGMSDVSSGADGAGVSP